MVKKRLPDLEQIPDEQVINLLRDEVQLSFKHFDAYQRRINRMTGQVYEEAARLLHHLWEGGEERSTGERF